MIDESLGTIIIEGMEIQLPCAYVDLAIHSVSDESKWIAPQESKFVDGMYDQQIAFKVCSFCKTVKLLIFCICIFDFRSRNCKTHCFLLN